MEIGCISINLRLILLGSCVQLFDELKICCLACNTYILLDAIDYNNMSKIFVACLGLALSSNCIAGTDLGCEDNSGNELVRCTEQSPLVHNVQGTDHEI